MNNEPVAWMYEDEPWFDGNKYHKKFELTFSEKVAIFKSGTIEKPTPLYTYPVKELTLTEDEIDDVWAACSTGESDTIDMHLFAEAILKKAQEK